MCVDVSDAIEEDDLPKLLSFIDDFDVDEFRYTHQQLRSEPQQLLDCVCAYSAVKCAEALIRGGTPLTVDVNLPCPKWGTYPLHRAALESDPCLTELLIYYGARTDIRTKLCNPLFDRPPNPLEEYSNKLPLHMALKAGLYFSPFISEWTPKHSIYKLLIALCLPGVQNELETIALLAWTTKETADEFIQFAKDGNILEVTALLVVAHKKLYDAMRKVCEHFESIENNPLLLEAEDQREKIVFMRQLFALFDSVGDRIEEYIREDKYYVDIYQTIKYVTRLFQEAGFRLEPSDTDFSDCKWFCIADRKPSNVSIRYLKDWDMEHYSKSGYRWEVLTKDHWRRLAHPSGYIYHSRNDVDFLKEEHVMPEKKLEQDLNQGAPWYSFFGNGVKAFASTITTIKHPGATNIPAKKHPGATCSLRQAPIASSLSVSVNGLMNGEAKNKMIGVKHNMWNFSSRASMAYF